MAKPIHSPKKKNIDNTGLSTNATVKYARFINKDGTPNVVHQGANILDRYSIYHFLINISNWKFILLIFGYYMLINLLFAGIYYIFCLDHLIGLIKGTAFETFEEVYFFSSQTLTTVGYGRISPEGLVTNTIASTEALIGILTLAIITGLLYGRFVKPKAYIRFSDRAVIAPFQDGKGLMFRMVPIKNARLSEISVQVTASMMVEENGKTINKVFALPLQFSTINILYLGWTVVHPINNDSPIWGMSFADLEVVDFEFMIYLKAYDEDFSNTVISRTSYTYDEIVNGAKFVTMYYDSTEGAGTIIDMKKLHDYTETPESRI
ncbi:Ion transport 2 domain protein [Taibaiella sp. KBW10]|uniref:ion channel n=1 Tax=Taibaiella sp. KBW10 TaxID=2153357 RepID=UPI000F5A0F60|nr:ion channel [Taibaiella sp. KBW10]RQO31578.1 Ion transport 2 domain protein [Taibaiella sp. KBW10]